ncbi:unnamed protein product [Gulo gulo]|uniref:Uncharacterized protein n=1 Tax=Gulo gulo TaxID=48420 RepID=A0A9X9LPD6_GULGU|nr:unnamed protein product [Gulo gulo]
MVTVSYARGPRPESGATTREIPVGSVSELVLWGPRQAARALGKGVAGIPTQELGRPSRGTAGLLRRLSEGAAGGD